MNVIQIASGWPRYKIMRLLKDFCGGERDLLPSIRTQMRLLLIWDVIFLKWCITESLDDTGCLRVLRLRSVPGRGGNIFLLWPVCCPPRSCAAVKRSVHLTFIWSLRVEILSKSVLWWSAFSFVPLFFFTIYVQIFRIRYVRLRVEFFRLLGYYAA